MVGRALASGAAHAAGGNVASIVLATPAGHAVAVGTAAAVVAAAPVVAVVALTGGVVYATVKIADWLGL
jgi:hypothetical protein